MKKFKKIDFYISVVLIVDFAIAGIFFDHSTFLNDTLVCGYFAVGAWQVTSMIVHAVNKYFTQKTGARCIYHWISFIAVIAMPTGLPWLGILYYAAPFMAVYYTYLCYKETFIKMRRPMDLLK